MVTPDLSRAQAVVAGCKHTYVYGGAHGVPGACAPCLSTYAEAVRQEERERYSKIIESSLLVFIFAVEKATRELREVSTTLRTPAGETG